jgi:hypothetical protein
LLFIHSCSFIVVARCSTHLYPCEAGSRPVITYTIKFILLFYGNPNVSTAAVILQFVQQLLFKSFTASASPPPTTTTNHHFDHIVIVALTEIIPTAAVAAWTCAQCAAQCGEGLHRQWGL